MSIKNTFNENLLSGKNIVVVGGSSGIGASSALDISELGGNLILIGRDKKRLQEVCERLKKNKEQKHCFYICDLNSFSSTEELFSKIKLKFDYINGLIWSAGTELIKPTRLLNEKDIENISNVIFRGAIGAAKAFCSKGFWPKNGGSLLFISSVSAIRANEGMLLYSAIKSSLSGMTKSLAIELSKGGTRVNSLILGAVETEMHKRITKNMSQDTLRDYEQKHLLGFGSTNDINPIIVYLMSDISRWTTGSEILIDGGYITK